MLTLISILIRDADTKKCALFWCLPFFVSICFFRLHSSLCVYDLCYWFSLEQQAKSLLLLLLLFWLNNLTRECKSSVSWKFTQLLYLCKKWNWFYFDSKFTCSQLNTACFCCLHFVFVYSLCLIRVLCLCCLLFVAGARLAFFCHQLLLLKKEAQFKSQVLVKWVSSEHSAAERQKAKQSNSCFSIAHTQRMHKHKTTNDKQDDEY